MTFNIQPFSVYDINTRHFTSSGSPLCFVRTSFVTGLQILEDDTTNREGDTKKVRRRYGGTKEVLAPNQFFLTHINCPRLRYFISALSLIKSYSIA